MPRSWPRACATRAWQWTWARDGLEAAAKLDLSSYDVVLLDRDLPGIHGDTLCQMITERNQRAMVLMLTAAREPGDRVTGLSLGADDYLSKPFHFPELVLRGRAMSAPDIQREVPGHGGGLHRQARRGCGQRARPCGGGAGAGRDRGREPRC